ncbi:MAG: YajQ family cyclic di-GMP-binding protein [Fimbriimonadaceae bacterium]|nr:YajQ family cyclic di-GMP-binding protein [Fimbriimonadaceae bacterium]
MATQEFSFDIVSKADMMEVKNAVSQAGKELDNRYDFRGSMASIELEKDEVHLVADDEFRMEQLREIVVSKLMKRGVEFKMIEMGKIEPGSGISVKQKLTFKNGIPQDQAKALVKQIKEKGLKVNAQVQGADVRVSGKSKDDLQKTIQFVKGLDLPYSVDFVNMR